MERKPVKSSNIVSAGYDPETGRAEIEFKPSKPGGKSCIYVCEGGVTLDEWKAFEKTFQTKDSSGSHFHRHLKSKAWSKS